MPHLHFPEPKKSPWLGTEKDHAHNALHGGGPLQPSPGHVERDIQKSLEDEVLPYGNPGPGLGPHGAVTHAEDVMWDGLSETEKHYARRQLHQERRQREKSNKKVIRRTKWDRYDYRSLKKKHLKKQCELLKEIGRLHRAEGDLQVLEHHLNARREAFKKFMEEAPEKEAKRKAAKKQRHRQSFITKPRDNNKDGDPLFEVSGPEIEPVLVEQKVTETTMQQDGTGETLHVIDEEQKEVYQTVGEDTVIPSDGGISGNPAGVEEGLGTGLALEEVQVKPSGLVDQGYTFDVGGSGGATGMVGGQDPANAEVIADAAAYDPSGER